MLAHSSCRSRDGSCFFCWLVCILCCWPLVPSWCVSKSSVSFRHKLSSYDGCDCRFWFLSSFCLWFYWSGSCGGIHREIAAWSLCFSSSAAPFLVSWLFLSRFSSVCWFLSCSPPFLVLDYEIFWQLISMSSHPNPKWIVKDQRSSMDQYLRRKPFKVGFIQLFPIKLFSFVFIYFVVVIEGISYVGYEFYKISVQLDLCMKVVVVKIVFLPLVVPP